MSKYGVYEMPLLTDQETLLAALAELGYGPDKVEVHQQPVHLIGVSGDTRAETAHIVIRRRNTGISASNDVGFLRQADGTFRAVVSEYDSRALRIGPNKESLVKAVERVYGKLNADRSLQTILKTTIPKLKAQGRVPFNATLRRVQTGNQTQLVLRF